MKSRILSVLVMSLVLTAFMFGPVSAKTLKIGSMGPLTGPYAADGNDIKNGVLTAIKVIEAEGGIPGYDKIELFPQDSACDPKQAVAAANKLINLEVSGVVGAYCSSSTIPASSTLADEDIIMITPASTHPDVTDRGLPYVFRMCGRDDSQGPAAVKFMKDVLKAKTIFIVDDKTTYSQGLADGVEKYCEEMGIKVLGHDHVNQGDKDFSAILTKAKSKQADAFYMSLQNHSSGSLMAIQAKRMGLKAQIMTEDAMIHPNFMKVGKKAVEGVYLTYGFTDKNTAAYKDFAKLFTADYGEFGAFAAYAYDSAMALLKSIKAAGSADPAKVKAEMLKLDYQGVAKYIKFNKHLDSGSSYIIYQVMGSEFVPYWSEVDGYLKK